jgi:hypothetical protein
MLLEALDFLAREVVADKSVEALARRADKLRPGAGAIISRLYVGAAAGQAVGNYAGLQTQQNIAKGMPSTVALEYTPEIAQYEKFALGSSRII